MPDKKTDFEEYLQEQHALHYTGLKDLVEDFNEWLQELAPDEWIEFGDKFGQELLNRK